VTNLCHRCGAVIYSTNGMCCMCGAGMGPVSTHGRALTPHKCPVCDGTGLVSRPPGVSGDQESWYGTWQAGPYPCKTCNGTGVLWS